MPRGNPQPRNPRNSLRNQAFVDFHHEDGPAAPSLRQQGSGRRSRFCAGHLPQAVCLPEAWLRERTKEHSSSL
jgi:hypothetical protein